MRTVLIFFLYVASGEVAFSQQFEIGPWRLGMNVTEVTSFEEYGPYVPVESTGGVETANGVFEGNARHVSFVFENSALSYIQVWNYEGSDSEVAIARVLETFDLFEERFGGAELPGIDVSGDQGLDRGAMEALLGRILGTAQELAEQTRREQNANIVVLFDMKPLEQPEASRLHALWGYSGGLNTFYVFLFQDRLDAPERGVPANVSLEPL